MTLSKPSVWAIAGGTVGVIAASVGVVSFIDHRNEEPSAVLDSSIRRRTQKAPAALEVILAHYNENLEWIDVASEAHPDIKHTVYSKADETPPGAIPMQNVGREGHTFLHHIVENYDNLANWTVFSQAAAPGFGFKSHQESGHMCSGVTWEDYIKPFPDGKDWYMVQTVATLFPQVWHSDRIDMMFRMEESKGEICPAGRSGWGGWWTEPDHPLIKFKNTPQGQKSLSAMDFYNTYVVADATDETYDSVMLNFANGGRFSVSRDRILRRSRQYYENLREQLSKEVNPIEGFYMEAMWYDVFHPERLQAEYGSVCEMPSPKQGATAHPVMYEEAVNRVFGQKSIPRDLQTSDPYIEPIGDNKGTTTGEPKTKKTKGAKKTKKTHTKAPKGDKKGAKGKKKSKVPKVAKVKKTKAPKGEKEAKLKKSKTPKTPKAKKTKAPKATKATKTKKSKGKKTMAPKRTR